MLTLWATTPTLIAMAIHTDSQDIDMPLFLGLVGAMTLLVLWPGLLVVHYAGVEVVSVHSRHSHHCERCTQQATIRPNLCSS